MIEKLIEFSLRNRLVVILAAGALAAAGYVRMQRTPVDAIPDVSENQVIVYADWPGRSPQEVEDQITYPLTSALRGLAGVTAVRGQSMFGFSLLYVIFEDGVDFYFARQRVLEKLPLVTLPEGVRAVLGPDGTGVGHVFWYTIENGWYCPKHPRRGTWDRPGKCPEDGTDRVPSRLDLGELRSLQDWYVRYALSALPGVAEVASVGGHVKQYQIDVDPHKLVAHGVTLGEVYEAVARANLNVGATVLEQNGAEHIVRGVGLLEGIRDIEEIVLSTSEGTPVTVRQVAAVQLGPEFRRGALEKDGAEAVGGVVMARQGVKFSDVVADVRRRLEGIRAGLPPGVRIVPFYDRTELVGRAIATLRTAILEQIVLIALSHIIFLMHFRSILIVTIPLPLAVLTSFLFMGSLDMTANIMSLAGIAIAIGELTDAGIVVTENAFRRIEQEGVDTRDRRRVWETVLSASKLVGRPIFYSMIIIIVAFLPVFALTGQSAKMFHPLAWTKTFAMIGAAVISVTLVPVLCTLLLRGRMHREEDNVLLRLARRVYLPVLSWALDHRALTIALAAILFVSACVAAFGAGTALLAPARLPLEAASLALGREVAPRLYARLSSWTDDLNLLVPGLGREYIPALDEQDLLFMPVTAPTVSLTGAVEIMKHQDAVLRSFPEVAQVVGKAGRAETATDPAPVSMFETVVDLKPYAEWPRRAIRESLVREAFERLMEASVADGTLRPHRHVVWKRRRDFYASIRGRELEPAVLEQKRVFEQTLRDSYEKQLVRPFLRNVTLAVDRYTRGRSAGPEAYRKMKEGLRPVFESAAFAAWMELLQSPALELYRRREPDPARVREILAKLDFSDPLERYTKERLRDDVLDPETRLVGVSNIWTQPIINRIDMLTTGVRTEIGIKIFGTGADNARILETLDELARKVARVAGGVAGAADVFPEPVKGAQFLEVKLDRARAARYGVSAEEALQAVEAAVGGRTAATMIEGRERYAVRIRYARDWRESLEDVGRILLPAADGGHVPLAMVADLRVASGPAMISSENGQLRATVFLNVRGRDVVGFVEEARRAVDRHVEFPPGFRVEWSGRYENTVRDNRRLLVVFPVTVGIIVLLLYFIYRSWREALHVALAIPFALTGGLAAMALLDYRFSTAVWVGFIALFGTAAETGIVMVIYLEEALARRERAGTRVTPAVLREAVMEGALLRLRPKLMTVGTTLAGLIPIMWSTGTGAEVMKPLAAPVLGGMFSSLLHVLVVTPVLFTAIRERAARRGGPAY
jgi:Cu(I)/Ag(I) efflux system membrane protein CusA/SilA